MNTDQKRDTGLDFLRVIAMLMVVVLHFLSKGGLLVSLSTTEKLTAANVTAWILEALCVVAVNAYMLISGYFLGQSDFKLSRLVRLYVQVWMFSVVVGLLSLPFGGMGEVSAYKLLQLFLPISMSHYWFMTAYFLLYLCLPLLGTAVRQFTQKQFQVTIGMLLLFYCGLKSILPIRLETDEKGYNFIWYMCVFLIAAYLRKYPTRWLKRKWICVCMYFGGSALIFAECFILRFIYMKTGALGYIMSVPIEYNHIFPLVAALGLFGWCKNADLPSRLGVLTGIMAPYTLGVYLFHENLGLRFCWPGWFGVEKIQSPVGLLVRMLIAVTVMFVLGVVLEFGRSRLVKVLHRKLLACPPYQRLSLKISTVDRIFR